MTLLYPRWSDIERSGGRVIRKRGGSLQIQGFAGRDPLTGRKRWLSRQVRGQTKAAYRQAKKVEAELLEQADRGERRGDRSQTVGELVERWLEWRQQVRPISPVTVANYRGAALVAAGQPVTGAPLAEAADVSASYGRALLAEFQADPTLLDLAQGNGQRPSSHVGEP